jgi:hypothetical protein
MHPTIGRLVHWRRRSTLERPDFLRYQRLLQRRSPLAPPESGVRCDCRATGIRPAREVHGCGRECALYVDSRRASTSLREKHRALGADQRPEHTLVTWIKEARKRQPTIYSHCRYSRGLQPTNKKLLIALLARPAIML